MSRIENIFYKIVKNENSTTELLCNLMNLKVFRDKFLSLFLSHDLHQFVFDNFDTQYTSGQGQPDMVIENDLFKILIEVKIYTWTNPTSNQPLGYLQELLSAHQKRKWLIFLIPKHYSFEAEIVSEIQGFMTSNASCGIDHKILYWEEIISIIEDNELHKINPFLAEFNTLLKAWYVTEEISFDPLEVITMFSDQIPKNRKILLKLKKLVDDIIGKNSSSNIEPSTTRTFLPDEYGVYFKDAKNHYVLFFGIWFVLWEKKSKPLCFGVNTKKYSQKVIMEFRKKYAGRIERIDEWEVTWFDDEVFSSANTVDIINNELTTFLSAVTA